MTETLAARPATLLGGRVRHAQPPAGHRTGLEPVLLAASIPAGPGDRMLEGGTGSGAGLLCVAARVAGAAGVGVEVQPTLAEIARENFAANGFSDLSVIVGDLVAARWEGSFDHAFANPPWHDPAGTAPPDAARAVARRAAPDLFALWAKALAGALRHHGTLTFVVAATALPACLAAFTAAGCGGLAVLPLWPRAASAAKLVLVRGVRGGRAPFRLLPGLVLHEASGAFTAAAEAILRDGAALDF
jgi:tRNA1(Val) A37 N6-methylase TrmN6